MAATLAEFILTKQSSIGPALLKFLASGAAKAGAKVGTKEYMLSDGVEVKAPKPKMPRFQSPEERLYMIGGALGGGALGAGLGGALLNKYMSRPEAAIVGGTVGSLGGTLLGNVLGYELAKRRGQGVSSSV